MFNQKWIVLLSKSRSILHSVYVLRVFSYIGDLTGLSVPRDMPPDAFFSFFLRSRSIFPLVKLTLEADLLGYVSTLKCVGSSTSAHIQ